MSDPMINQNHVNRELSYILNLCRESLRPQVRSRCGVDASILLARLMQLVAQMSVEPLARTVRGAMDVRMGTQSQVLDCGAFCLERSTGRLKVKARARLNAFFAFIQHWGFLLLNILRPASENTNPATLLMQMAPWDVFRNGTDRQFIEFCKSGPVVPLRTAARLIVELPKQCGATTSEYVTYERRPLLSLLAQTKLGKPERLALFFKLLVLGYSYLWAVFRSPSMALLATELPYVVISRALDQRFRIEAVVLTLSSVSVQPLWMRCLSNAFVHMVWYAQSYKPICWTASPVESDFVALEYMKVREHWVWTHQFSDYIEQFQPNSQVNVVGPLLWYLPSPIAAVDPEIKVVVFDVSPFSDAVALTGGGFPNYYSSENMACFVDDVTFVLQRISGYLGREIRVGLKTKRGYKLGYDRDYFEKLGRMQDGDQIALIPSDENMYSLISGSHLVICYPFTSPAYVASHIGVPAIYHDPTGAVVYNAFGGANDGIGFTRSRDELYAAVMFILNGAD